MNPMEERIEEYLKGRMSASDKQAFEALMATDSELKSVVENYSKMENVAESLLELQLLDEVKAVSKENIPDSNEFIKRKVPKKNRFFVWVGLLFLAIAIVLTVKFYQEGEMEKKDEIFAEMYKRPTDVNTVRSISDPSTLNPYEFAKYQFSLNNWESSIHSWENIIQNTQDPDTLSTAHYYLGHIYLNQYEFDKARMAFAKSQRSDIPQYIELIDLLEK